MFWAWLGGLTEEMGYCLGLHSGEGAEGVLAELGFGDGVAVSRDGQLVWFILALLFCSMPCSSRCPSLLFALFPFFLSLPLLASVLSALLSSPLLQKTHLGPYWLLKDW